jgi:ABC-type dipeptide/oligopeptide/nickel transport system permease subunit
MRIARGVYESLPYVYMLVGLAAIAASFMWRVPVWSGVMGVFGLIALVSGLVLVLRRRDYRIQKRRYGAEFDDDE